MKNPTVLIVVGIIVLVLVFRVASYLLANRAATNQGRTNEYGYLGGAICPNCGRPFALHWWSLKLGIGRLDRCPYCKKWNLVNRASMEALLAAEDALFEVESRGHQLEDAGDSEEDDYRKLIDDSRYDHS